MSKTYVLYPFVPTHVPKKTALATVICKGCGKPFLVERWRQNIRTYCKKECKWSTPKDRLFKSLVKQENGCWNWTGTVNRKSGYGQISAWGRTIGPHQLSYLVHHGPIPDGYWVLHKCIGNRLCCNPDHLYTGTPAQNVKDMIDQGRFRVANGSEAGQSKLTEEQVRFILSMKGIMTQKELAQKFNVVQATISFIMSRRNWKHLNIDSPPTV